MKLLESDPEIYRDLYRDRDIPLPENYVEKAAIKTPKLPPDIHFAEERQVGNLRKTLKKKGLDKSTIIIFTSDHGLLFGEFGLGVKPFATKFARTFP